MEKEYLLATVTDIYPTFNTRKTSNKTIIQAGNNELRSVAPEVVWRPHYQSEI